MTKNLKIVRLESPMRPSRRMLERMRTESRRWWAGSTANTRAELVREPVERHLVEKEFPSTFLMYIFATAAIILSSQFSVRNAEKP